MHNMALALHEMGYKVTGSDDEINEPSKSRLAKAGILPAATGWFPEKITGDLEAVILGMHARADNPELQKAKELGLKIFSYPEYIYQASRDKKRIVIGGSHGKTTITAMILHALHNCGIETDYLVGAQLDGFNTMVRITSSAKFMVIEGDEYLASPIDRRPKFHLYHPDIAVLSGIAWDHINVFPTFDIYVDQFRQFISLITAGGSLAYSANDPVLKALCSENFANDFTKIPYTIPKHEIVDGTTFVKHQGDRYPLLVFGNHNLMNLNAAMIVCRQVGVPEKDFLKAMATFKGASRRLELVDKRVGFNFYKDFAHSPSKLKATTDAVKQQFPTRKLIACMELHTFSSLNEEFLLQYKDSMNLADEAMVYFNPHTIEHKKLKPITEDQVLRCFNRPDLKVYTDSKSLVKDLQLKKYGNTVLLMMSSGNFDGVDFAALSKELQTD